MDINTPFWSTADGTIHQQEACALEHRAARDPWGDEPQRTTYGDVVSRARGPVKWCPRCGTANNPAAKGTLDPGVGA